MRYLLLVALMAVLLFSVVTAASAATGRVSPSSGWWSASYNPDPYKAPTHHPLTSDELALCTTTDGKTFGTTAPADGPVIYWTPGAHHGFTFNLSGVPLDRLIRLTVTYRGKITIDKPDLPFHPTLPFYAGIDMFEPASPLSVPTLSDNWDLIASSNPALWEEGGAFDMVGEQKGAPARSHVGPGGSVRVGISYSGWIAGNSTITLSTDSIFLEWETSEE
jgi:hypothetical protein